ncbi:MAG TPA: 3-phosphoshikimate 1-carboxyvinyltransferase [Coxiellaceae bacterium]|nr:MAG: hypothetical protein A3E81_06775 [Gammaproteobacteria bacterium RIFCSPHIGHO2_12_FULL_36_30]HLB56470.1 3-phosphoshikimate 1-carboxyvinyltransferase [Coxiellaceae bacterium]
MGDIFCISPNQKIVGDIFVSGDKSISHRAVILSSIRDEITTISNLLLADDVLNTVEAMRELGVEIIIDEEKKSARVYGVGLHGLKAPKNPINCGNSGTAMRLLCGLLCAQKFNSILIGDDSLSKRPMLRVAEPLRLMGAKINLSENNTAPIEIIGSQKLNAISYELKIPSAQVKSAILLASLYAQGETFVHEKTKTRDHTEKMLACNNIEIKIPGDISSAAFFIVLAAITKDSNLIIREVGVNPFRTGIIDILKLMGANIKIFNKTFFGNEPVADIQIQYAPLHGRTIPQELISNAIDEFPIIFIAAATAKGNTLLRGAKELRVKESDRIACMKKNFDALNIQTEEYNDGILIYGDQAFHGGRVDSFGDHRIAMSFAIAGNVAKDPVFVDNCELIKTSFPNFLKLAKQVGMKVCNTE